MNVQIDDRRNANLIRESCLRPFDAGWAQPTPDEVRAVLRNAGLTAAEAARLVGISDGRTVRRWTGGDSPIPYAAWALLCDHAGISTIWRMQAAGGHHVK